MKSWTKLGTATALGALMLSAFGLVLSVYIRQLENFAGTMNFVIFPMFFISPALYPLWKLREVGADIVYWGAQVNPFTHTIELIRYAIYGKFNGVALLVVIGVTLVCFVLAAIGYDPQRGMIQRIGRAN